MFIHNNRPKHRPYQMSLLENAQRSSSSAEGPRDSFAPAQNLTGMSAPEAVKAAESLLQQGHPQVDIRDVQAQLTRELPEVDVKFLNTDRFGELNGRLANETELKAMMEALYDESEIPYGYITDGCYARAHLMDESFRQHGINYAKMFVRGDLAAKNDLMTARWWYHVAPLVFVDDGEGNPQAKIIDPGFSLKPMDPEEWVKVMNQGPRIQVDLVEAEQYYPRRGSKPDTFQESIPPAVTRMHDYSRRLHGIKEDKGLPVGDYQRPDWEPLGSGGDFEVDGETRTIFPQGVQHRGRWYLPTGLGVSGLQLDLFDTRIGPDVSAAWDNRPDGFDPYSAD